MWEPTGERRKEVEADDQGENKNNNKIKLRDGSCNDNDELVL